MKNLTVCGNSGTIGQNNTHQGIPMALGLKTPEGENPAAVGRNLIDSLKKPLNSIRGVDFFSKKPLSPRQRLSLLIGISAITVASIIPFAILDKGPNAQAKEPNFPDTAPKKPLTLRPQRVETDYYLQDLRTYVDPNGNTYGVGLVSLTQDPDHNQYAVLGEFDSSGRFILNSLGKVPFFGIAAAGSPTDKKTAVVIGDQERGANKGMVFAIKDRGQVIDRSANGTMRDIQPSPNGRYEYISQSTMNPGDNSTIMAQLDLSNNAVTDMKVIGVSGQQAVIGSSQMLSSPDGTYSNYGRLPLSLGFYKVFYQPQFGFSSRLGPDTYLYGRLRALIDSEDKDVVIGFDNDSNGTGSNNPNLRTATGYKSRFDRNTGQPVDEINFQLQRSLYPAPYANLSIVSGYSVADVSSDRLFMNAGIIGDNNEHYSFIETALLSDPSNYARHQLWPLVGDWPAQGTINLMDSAIFNGNKKLLVNVGSSTQPGISALRFCDIANCIFEKAPLILPAPNTLYLPLVKKD